jgi:hypothetical protein
MVVKGILDIAKWFTGIAGAVAIIAGIAVSNYFKKKVVFCNGKIVIL